MKRLEGYLDNGRGEPLADIPATATILGTSTVVDTTMTDADGHWSFSGLPTANEYVVTLSDPTGNAVSRAPWSGEMRELWVRDRLDVAGKPLSLDPAAGNSLLWTATGLYAPTGMTQAQADARYPLKTDVDPYPTYLTSTEADALFLTPAEGNAAYAALAHNHDTTYLALAGGTLTGPLLIPNGTVSAPSLRFSSGTTPADDGMYRTASFSTAFANNGARVLGISGSGLDVVGAVYMTGALTTEATLTVMGASTTAAILPDTNNTRDLGTTGTRWRALYGMTADLTTSLTVASKAVGVSATGGNTLSWNSDGFYVAAGAVTDIWVNTTGDTMTGDLNMTANVLPTVTNVRSLGSTSLRWLKVWAQDADFTNTPTVGASLLTTVAASDASYVKLAGGSVMTGLLGPTTNNTRDLGTTALRWRKLWGVDADLSGTLAVLGAATVSGLLKGQAGLDITGNAVFDTSNVSINGTLGATGLTSALGGLAVTGATTMTGALTINAPFAVGLTIKGSGAGDNSQLRFRGNVSAVDQWAVGNEVATSIVARNFDIYDLVAGANRLRIDSTGLISIPKYLSVGGSQLLANVTVKGDPTASGAIMLLDGNANNGYLTGAGIDGSYTLTRFVSGAYTNRVHVSSTGRVGIGAKADGTAVATLDVQSPATGAATVMVRPHASEGNAMSNLAVWNAAQNAIVLGATNLGWVADLISAQAIGTFATKRIPVYNSGGVLQGYIPLYN